MSFNQYRPSGFMGLTPIVKNLIIINVLFFLAMMGVENITRGGTDLNDVLGLHYWGSDKFEPYQFVTYMFMHGGFSHIFFNMFAVWMFGNVLEQVWGPKRFLIYYLVTGVGAGVLHMLIMWFQFSGLQAEINTFMLQPTPVDFEALVQHSFEGRYNPEALAQLVHNWTLAPADPVWISEASKALQSLLSAQMDIPTVGASGAVFGILLAFGMLFPNSLLYLYFAIPIKAKWFVILYGGFELYSGIANNPGDNVAHFAHLGGMLFGFILIRFWKTRRYE